MNLLTDAWIPVKRNAEPCHISFKELLCTKESFELSHPRDDMELAALQLLVCLAQCIFMPKDKEELLLRIRTPLAENEYDKGTEPYTKWFSLNDPLYPFMQDIAAKNEVVTGIQKLFPGMPEGNGSSTLFVAQDEFPKVCASCTAITLFNQATDAPSFGGGTKAPLRGSAPITVFVYAKDLRRMIWNNTMDLSWIMDTSIYKEGSENEPVWVNKLKKGDTIDTTSIGLLRGLFWQPAYLCLHWKSSQNPVVCPCCGRVSNEFAETFGKNKFAYTLSKPNWRHPHSPYVVNEKEKDLKVLSYNKDNGFPLWSRLCDMLPLNQTNPDLLTWSLPVKRYAGLRSYSDVLPLVVGGYKNSKASILERNHTIVSIGAGWVCDEERLGMLHNVVQMALSFRECLSKKAFAFGKSIDKSSTSKIPSGISNKAAACFFQDTEFLMHKHITKEPFPRIYLVTSQELKETCLKIFDEVTKPYLCNAQAQGSYYQKKYLLRKDLNTIVEAQRPIVL